MPAELASPAGPAGRSRARRTRRYSPTPWSRRLRTGSSGTSGTTRSRWMTTAGGCWPGGWPSSIPAWPTARTVAQPGFAGWPYWPPRRPATGHRPSIERDRSFWLSRFADRPDPVSLGAPTVAVPGQVQHRTAPLAQDSAAALRAAARQTGRGWQRIVLAAGAACLSRLSGVCDVVFGVAVPGRGSPAAKTAPTRMADVLPLRLAVGPQSSISELASQAAAEVRNLQRHQRFRSAELRSELDWPGNARLDFGPEINIMPARLGLTFAGHRAIVHQLSFWSASDLSIS